VRISPPDFEKSLEIPPFDKTLLVRVSGLNHPSSGGFLLAFQSLDRLSFPF
jgi:hypothetical protein